MKDIGTFAGSSAAVLAVVNVIQQISGWFEMWFALAVAIAIATGTTFLIKDLKSGFGAKLFRSILTGFMLYASAFGLQNSVVSEIAGDDGMLEATAPEVYSAPPPPSDIVPVRPLPVERVPRELDTRQFTTPWGRR